MLLSKRQTELFNPELHLKLFNLVQKMINVEFSLLGSYTCDHLTVGKND